MTDTVYTYRPDRQVSFLLKLELNSAVLGYETDTKSTFSNWN